MAYITGDPFHPGRLVKVWDERDNIASAQFMGYGVLDDVQTPIMRLILTNGSAIDVFDADGIWHTEKA